MFRLLLATLLVMLIALTVWAAMLLVVMGKVYQVIRSWN